MVKFQGARRPCLAERQHRERFEGREGKRERERADTDLRPDVRSFLRDWGKGDVWSRWSGQEGEVCKGMGDGELGWVSSSWL